METGQGYSGNLQIQIYGQNLMENRWFYSYFGLFNFSKRLFLTLQKTKDGHKGPTDRPALGKQPHILFVLADDYGALMKKKSL